MTTNFSYAGTGQGVIKIVHIVFGLISAACMAAAYSDEEFKVRFFFGSVLTVFLVSIIYFIVHLVSEEVAYSGANRIVSALYHFIGAALLIVAASLFLELTVSENKHCRPPAGYDPIKELCGNYDTKLTAGAFSIMNGVLYLVATVLSGMGGGGDDNADVYKS
jgi:hypothetical protein